MRTIRQGFADLRQRILQFPMAFCINIEEPQLSEIFICQNKNKAAGIIHHPM